MPLEFYRFCLSYYKTTSLLIFPFEVYLSIVVLAKFTAESEVSLRNDIVLAENLLGLKNFGYVDFLTAFMMVVLSRLRVPHNFANLN